MKTSQQVKRNNPNKSVRQRAENGVKLFQSHHANWLDDLYEQERNSSSRKPQMGEVVKEEEEEEEKNLPNLAPRGQKKKKKTRENGFSVLSQNGKRGFWFGDTRWVHLPLRDHRGNDAGAPSWVSGCDELCGSSIHSRCLLQSNRCPVPLWFQDLQWSLRVRFLGGYHWRDGGR